MSEYAFAESTESTAGRPASKAESRPASKAESRPASKAESSKSAAEDVEEIRDVEGDGRQSAASSAASSVS